MFDHLYTRKISKIMANREDTLRNIEGNDLVLRDIVEDLTGKVLLPGAATDLNSLLPPGEDEAPTKTIRSQQSTRKSTRRNNKLDKRRAKLKGEEEKFSNLMIRLKAGDPSAHGYEERLKSAKHSTRLREELPKAAQKKWANKEFQQKMEDRGFTYNCAEWKGWLPYEVARELQQKMIGAKSRGEYEVYMKLFTIRFLPARPDRVYGESWKGWNDFLGTVNIFGKHRQIVDPSEYRSFYEALTFARSLKLRNLKQWQAACRDGRVPLDVPIDPHNVYPNEFVDIAHWLGTTKAVEVVRGKAIAREVWVLYTDGREDACWWAKMSVDKYADFAVLDGIKVVRAYEFEGEHATSVWVIFDALSEVYEEDMRERLIGRGALFEITERLDAILKWLV